MEIINTYSGLGYSSLNWDRKKHNIIHIEYNDKIIKNFKSNFPNDVVLNCDALEFIHNTLDVMRETKNELKHPQRYENAIAKRNHFLAKYEGKTIFIWCSPSCITHSQLNMVRGHNISDMTSLYGLITFLRYKSEYLMKNFDVKIFWIVENVNPWYNVLIEPTFRLGRHLFWSNFDVEEKVFVSPNVQTLSYKQLNEQLCDSKINLDTLREDKDLTYIDIRQMVRNGLNPSIGEHILNHVERYNELEHKSSSPTKHLYTLDRI